MARASVYLACIFLGILIGSQATKWWPPLAPDALPLAIGAAVGVLLMALWAMPSRIHQAPPGKPQAEPEPATLAEKKVSMEHARYQDQIAHSPETQTPGDH